MTWLLDTNVISELVRPRPDKNVAGWVHGLSTLDLSLSVLTIGELEKGIASLPMGPRRLQLTQWAHSELPRQFQGRLIGVDSDVAIAWGQLAAAAQSDGRPLPVVDGLLLATARVHNLTLATRNVSDCARRGVAIFDPWTGTLHS